MIAEISSRTFDSFFAVAPWVAGVIIYCIFFIAKRSERAAPVPAQPTYACSACGRRGTREQMVPQQHGGAVGWQCAACAASSHAPAH